MGSVLQGSPNRLRLQSDVRFATAHGNAQQHVSDNRKRAIFHKRVHARFGRRGNRQHGIKVLGYVPS